MVSICPFFIPKEYQSYATFFPPASNNLEHAIDNPNFGYDVEADRAIQLLESRRMRDSITKRFNLIQYYELDTSKAAWESQLGKRWHEDVSFTRTTSMSLLMEVKTRNPELSADIANAILELVDPIRNDMLKYNTRLAVEELEAEYQKKQALTDSLVGAIASLRQETKNNTLALLTNQFYQFREEAKANPNFTNNTQLEYLINQYFYAQANLNQTKDKLQRAKAQMQRPISQIYVLDRAKPNYKKVSPSFTVNGLIGIFGALILFVLFYFFRFKYRELEENAQA